MFIVFFFFVFRIVCIRHRRKVHIRYLISDEFLVFIWVLLFFLYKKSGLSSGNTAAHSTANLRHVVYTRIVQCYYLSILIHDQGMHPNTSVS